MPVEYEKDTTEELIEAIEAREEVRMAIGCSGDMAIDVFFHDNGGEMLHRTLINLMNANGYEVSYVAFDSNTVCFMEKQ